MTVHLEIPSNFAIPLTVFVFSYDVLLHARPSMLLFLSILLCSFLSASYRWCLPLYNALFSMHAFHFSFSTIACKCRSSVCMSCYCLYSTHTHTNTCTSISSLHSRFSIVLCSRDMFDRSLTKKALEWEQHTVLVCKCMRLIWHIILLAAIEFYSIIVVHHILVLVCVALNDSAYTL